MSAYHEGNMDVEQTLAQGIALHKSGDLPSAEKIYREILVSTPEHADAIHLLGVIAYQTGHFQEAADLIERAITIKPATPYFLNLGNAYHSLLDYDRATENFLKVLTAEPHHVMAHVNLANTYLAMKDYQRAIVSYHAAINLSPNSAEALTGLGLVCFELGRFEEALELHAKAAANAKSQLEFYLTNSAQTLIAVKHYDEAERVLRAAIAQNPNLVEPHVHLAHLYLRTGRFEQGWKEYEWRLKRPGAERPPTSEGALTGNIKGEKILVIAEQGLGDSLQFVRFCKQLVDAGAIVDIFAPVNLKEFFGQLKFIRSVVTGSDGLEPYHHIVSMLSLPLSLKLNHPKQFEMSEPYLAADSMRVEKWKERLDSAATGKNYRVGLCWQGSTVHKMDAFRSIPLVNFEKLIASRQDIAWVSLQKVDSQAQLKKAPFSKQIVDFTAEMDADGSAFPDAAAIIENLDLVITVDTAIAHLAGAMGKPVWILLGANSDWRWLDLGRETSWYPSARIFRGGQPMKWDVVMTEVADALRSKV